jgi:hypothetical protein
MKKALLIIIGLALIGAGFWYWRLRGTQELASERAARLQVSEYSFEGEVVALGEDTVTVRTGQVERTNVGNLFVEHEKKVRLSPKTVFSVSFSPEAAPTTLSPAEIIALLRVGDRIVFYGPGEGNSLTADEFTATRVEVI